jgi:hypothetical protein
MTSSLYFIVSHTEDANLAMAKIGTMGHGGLVVTALVPPVETYGWRRPQLPTDRSLVLSTTPAAAPLPLLGASALAVLS